MEKDKSKYSAASKARWAKKTKEERSQQMRELVNKRWSKIKSNLNNK